MYLLLPLLISICIWNQTVTTLFCYWNSGCTYNQFSSKTPYNVVRGDIRDSIVKMNGCEPVSIWGLHRHGKIYPEIIIGKQMKEAVSIRDYVESSFIKGNSSLCAQDVEYLHNWVFDTHLLERPCELTDDGYQELLGLGKRLKQEFPKLLSKLDEGTYKFHPALGGAIKKSAESFIKGLGHENLSIEKPIHDSDTLKFDQKCGKYQSVKMEYPDLHYEVIKYLSNPDYLVAKDRIQRRTGIAYTLTDENITSLYNLCSWSEMYNEPRPWCALFTTEDLKILEYVEDLKYYYKSGYGLPDNNEGSFPLKDLFKTFQLAKSGQAKKLTAYFTNASMMNMVYSTLGLFKDKEHLNGTHRDQNRKWRTGKHSVFAANVLAILNRCTKVDVAEYKVVFYLNEKPLRSICDEGVCTWNEFEEILTPILNITSDFGNLETNE